MGIYVLDLLTNQSLNLLESRACKLVWYLIRHPRGLQWNARDLCTNTYFDVYIKEEIKDTDTTNVLLWVLM